MKEMFDAIKRSDVTTVIFDIDGTLKDLCGEHNDALEKVLTWYVVGRKTRKKIVCFVNKIAMTIVKSGLVPTNHFMQDTLIIFYSAILGTCIKELYYEQYKKEIKLFGGVKENIERICQTKQIYFVTVNKQNYNIEELGISENLIECTNGNLKFKAYKSLLKEKHLNKQEVIIVGDNIFDDMLPAKILSAKFLLVDNYNCKIKKFIMRK